MARETARRSKRSRGGAGFGRALSLLAFLPIASRVPMYTRLITSLVMDERMPVQRKALLAGAAGYLVLGRDLIPDDIPIIGGLDDLVVVVLAAELFLDPLAISVLDLEHSGTEERWVTVGRDRRGRVLVLIHTFQEQPVGEWKVRIISARKATRREAKQYDGLGP